METPTRINEIDNDDNLNSDVVNILYSTNEPFFKQMLISAFSMMKNTKSPLNIINLTFEVPEYNAKRKKTNEKQKAFMAGLVKKYNTRSTFKSIDVSDLFRKTLLKGPNLNNKLYSYFNTVRLVADLVPEVPSKVIYLDADTIINGDIKEFYDLDLGKYELLGLRETGRITKYVCAGVLLMDMDKIRKNNSLEKARWWITKVPLLFLDMDAMNFGCSHHPVSKHYISFNYDPNAIIHHLACIREGKVLFTKKWRHRIKPDECALVREKIPEYNAFYDEVDKILKEYEDFTEV